MGFLGWSCFEYFHQFISGLLGCLVGQVDSVWFKYEVDGVGVDGLLVGFLM